MERKITGKYITISTVGGEKCQAFIPRPLPPKPPLKIDSDIQNYMEKALLALGRLDSVTTLLPNTSLFLYMYVRKEAVLSSQIEGTQSSLSDLLLYESDETPGVPLDDVKEVSNYTRALTYGISRIREDFPISIRLIKEIHRELLIKGRGADKDPGEFRRTQNWIGGTRPGNAVFVPPPHTEVLSCMGDLEIFLHDKSVPILIRAALAHAQFETIHPFLDGNGRVGRLLITLLLCSQNVLKDPMLYLSLYFKRNRELYYKLLQRTRVNGDWENWVKFLLLGIIETAELAVITAKKLAEIIEADRKKIETLGRPAGSAIRVHDVFQQWPILSLSRVVKSTKLTFPTVKSAMLNLVRLEIAEEILDNKRGRRFKYKEYIRILNEGTELID